MKRTNVGYDVIGNRNLNFLCCRGANLAIQRVSFDKDRKASSRMLVTNWDKSAANQQGL